MCWGDNTLHKTACGKEFLEFNEGQTKTRDGSYCRDVRPVTPKMFATDGSEKDPVVVYKHFTERRPQQMMNGRLSLLFGSKQLEIKVTWNQKHACMRAYPRPSQKELASMLSIS